jgi:hypothetical protein
MNLENKVNYFYFLHPQKKNKEKERNREINWQNKKGEDHGQKTKFNSMHIVS